MVYRPLLILSTLVWSFTPRLSAQSKTPDSLAHERTLELFGGVALILTQGKPVSGVPAAFGAVFTGKVAGLVPIPLVVFLVCAAVAGAIVAFNNGDRGDFNIGPLTPGSTMTYYFCQRGKKDDGSYVWSPVVSASGTVGNGQRSGGV